MFKAFMAAVAALLWLASALPATAAANPEQTADAIVARHIEARGGEAALRALRTVVYDRGAYREPGFEQPGTAVMMLKRPYLKLVGHPLRKPESMEGYDGAAWEWYQDPGITLRVTGAASEALRHYAEIEGPFLDYKAKGSTIELIGRATVDGRPAHQLRLTMMDGYASDFLIDAKTFLIVASRHSAKIHAFGDEVTSETRFEDYRPVAGVKFPFRGREVEIASGRELSAMQWGSIEANVELPDAWFSPPVYQRTPLQTFMDHLFIQRTDVKSLLWTYHSFRRTNPGVDTREAGQVVGFQMLKANHPEAAIALLERNAADYPQSADSAFGLGRAYAGAGRPRDARAEFERALKLEPGHPRSTKALAALPAA